MIVGVFSPASGKQEIQVGKVIKSVYPEVSMTLSHEVGLIGLLERENASVLNESLKPLCKQTVEAFCDALKTLGLKCPFYLTQNDGTVIRYSQNSNPMHVLLLLTWKFCTKTLAIELTSREQYILR